MNAALSSSSAPLSSPTRPNGSVPPLSDATILVLNALLEGFSDGLVIVDPHRGLHHINRKGKDILRCLPQEGTAPLPSCLHAMAEHMVESRDLFPTHKLILSQTITCHDNRRIRVRMQWLSLGPREEDSLLILLEDQTATAHTAALLEAVRYDLTPRETEVWVLRRAGHSYEAIAADLYITINTVKRHLKSIHAKRRGADDDLADGLVYSQS